MASAPTDRYPCYVLGVLLLVYVCNFLDRQIISILAERIRADPGVTDAQLGFVYGTAFAVFFAWIALGIGGRHVGRDQASRLDRARAAGEPA